MAIECKKEGCKELVAGHARGGYCKDHAKPSDTRRQKTVCRVCGRDFLVKREHHGPYKVDGKIHCYECFDEYKKIHPPNVPERRDSPKTRDALTIFEEEIKARIGYAEREPFDCCNTCRSRVGELCNKWAPLTFRHGGYGGKCEHYMRRGDV